MKLASGQTNWDLIYGPQGLNARRELRKLGRLQKFIERHGIKLTLPALMPGAIPLAEEAESETPSEKEVNA